eukprot:6194916-Prymnesium_polylepis.1
MGACDGRAGGDACGRVSEPPERAVILREGHRAPVWFGSAPVLRKDLAIAAAEQRRSARPSTQQRSTRHMQSVHPQPPSPRVLACRPSAHCRRACGATRESSAWPRHLRPQLRRVLWIGRCPQPRVHQTKKLQGAVQHRYT